MFRRPSLRSTATTLAAAAVLVGGADLASYAATGQPLVLGHHNAAGATTSLKNTGRGPALSLNSARSVPPLTVNSSKLVKHLNADRLDGLRADQVNPSTIEYRLGGENATLSAAQHLVLIKAPPGDQEVSMDGIWTSDVSTDSMICLIWDQRFLTDNTNLSYIYALFQKSLSDPDSNFISSHAFLHFGKHQKLLVGCATTGDTGVVRTAHPITFTFHKTSISVKHGTPTTVSRTALRRGSHAG